jgi:hypothetical protein
MSIRKIRDSSFLCGQHDYVIETGGVTVFPRIVPREQYRDFVLEPVSRGIEGMDILFGRRFGPPSRTSRPPTPMFFTAGVCWRILRTGNLPAFISALISWISLVSCQ